MAEPYISEIRILPYDFAPRGWAMCDGQYLSIAQNMALYSLLGTRFGGDGNTIFALPDLRGRVPLHFDVNHPLGQSGGAREVTLDASQLPAHSHALNASSRLGTEPAPAGNALAATGVAQYGPPDALTPLHADTVGVVGGGAAHTNMQPFQALSFVIALQGIYPSRP